MWLLVETQPHLCQQIFLFSLILNLKKNQNFQQLHKFIAENAQKIIYSFMAATKDENEKDFGTLHSFFTYLLSMWK